MSRIMALLKINIKLLLRNKGFLFFLCVTPIVSTIILSLKTEYAMKSDEVPQDTIVELDDCSDKAAYMGDANGYVAYKVKVYDSAGTELSEYVLERLAATGMLCVCRCKVQGMTVEEAEAQAKKDAYDDRAGVILYLSATFDECVLEGNLQGAMQIYPTSDDERWELFEAKLTELLSQINEAAEYAGADSRVVIGLLTGIREQFPHKQVVTISGGDGVELTAEQFAQKSQIGYAMAIITLGFLFCGVCVAYTVIEEQNNRVYTRIMLSDLSRTEYFIMKFLLSVIFAVMQTGILGICIFALQDMDFGISKYSFLFIILCLGLIFNVVSLLIGILLGDVMSANYVVFTLWSISGLLAGLYFSMEFTSKGLQALSYLMPQRWFIDAVEKLFTGDKSAYSMILYVTVAYLVLTISVGGVGLRMKRGDA